MSNAAAYTYEPAKHPPMTVKDLIRQSPNLRTANPAILELMVLRINRAVDEFEKSPQFKAYKAEMERELYGESSYPPVRGGLADLLNGGKS